MRYILNTPVITAYGEYQFRPVSVDGAREWARRGDFVSAVGHASTAELMSAVLGVDIKFNRVAITMAPGDQALVFRLLIRPEEGRLLSSEELSALPHEFGVLTRTS